MKNYCWKIGGEAGFGIMTMGLLFGKYLARHGYEVFGYSEYPSLIRGGHNTYEINFSLEKIRSSKWMIDFLVCLNEETYVNHKNRLKKGAVVFYDPDSFKIEREDLTLVPVNLKEILGKKNDPFVFANNLMLGASIGYLGGDLSSFEELLTEHFESKGREILKKNLYYGKLGYKIGANALGSNPKLINSKVTKKEKAVLTGNEAFSLGCVAADCRFYAAYPMTPASSVLTVLASWQEKTGMIVRHAEDEIGVVNEALGASFAGVRAAVGTSGGGLALMSESLSYAGLAEIPLVLFLAQRPGPATGMPTWTEQGDLLFSIYAGHGEFMKIVLAPGDVEEMLELTPLAFNLADIYQTPVILISDKFLSESFSSTSKRLAEKLLEKFGIDRGKLITSKSKAPRNYLRYKLTKDGISPRLLPGIDGFFYQANSYEHLEDSHTTEDAVVRVEQVNKRARKIETYLKNHFRPPQIYGDIEKAKLVIVGWGSVKGLVLDAVDILKDKRGEEIAFIHFNFVYPLDERKLKSIFSKVNGRLVLVENNSFAQFGRLLRSYGIFIQDRVLKYNGRPFYPEELVASFEKLL